MARFIPTKYKALLEIEDRVDAKNLPALRSAIRSLYPNIKPHDLANFVNFGKKYLGTVVNSQFNGKQDVLQQVQGIREMSYKGGAQAEQITTMMDAFKSIQNNSFVSAETSDQIQGKTTLRSRYDLPGADDFKDSDEQQAIDITSAQLFDMPSQLPAVGISTFDLQNKWREQWTKKNAFLPRPCLGHESQAAFGSMLFERSYSADEMEIMMENEISAEISKIHAMNSDVNMLNDSIAGKIFMDQTPLPGPFKLDTFFPLAHGWPYMKQDTSANWRQPFKPPVDTFLPMGSYGAEQHMQGLDTQPMWQQTYDPSKSTFDYGRSDLS